MASYRYQFTFRAPDDQHAAVMGEDMTRLLLAVFEEDWDGVAGLARSAEGEEDRAERYRVDKVLESLPTHVTDEFSRVTNAQIETLEPPAYERTGEEPWNERPST